MTIDDLVTIFRDKESGRLVASPKKDILFTAETFLWLGQTMMEIEQEEMRYLLEGKPADSEINTEREKTKNENG
jgi:hypothetical protein